jgi:heme exporter protein D
MGDFSQCLYEWQGLEGGLLALVAAILGAVFLSRQIRQSDRHERERLHREHSAVRATLPLTLSGLVEHLRGMLLALNAVKADLREHGSTRAFNPPAVPAQYVVELQSVIASTDQPDVVEPISEIIRQIQTLWARVEVLQNQRDQARRAGLHLNVDDWIIQAAQIHALTESLFDYARAESTQGPKAVSWERAESVIFQLGIETSNLVECVKRGVEKSENFWTIS